MPPGAFLVLYGGLFQLVKGSRSEQIDEWNERCESLEGKGPGGVLLKNLGGSVRLTP